MQRVIILSLLCVSAWLLPSKLAGKVESPDNGAPGKPKWLLSNTKLRAEATKTDRTEEVPEEPEELDQAEVAHQVREAVDARSEGYR